MTDHQHTAETLHRAADHISAFGLYKGSGIGPGRIATAPMCTVGALTYVSDSSDSTYLGLALQAVRDYIGHDRSIPRWSDDPERTASEVIEVLRSAAAIEQAKHDAEQPATVAVGA